MIDFTRIERYRENNRLEAKRAQGGFPHSVWETVVSFANTVGGLILLGVIEDENHAFHPVTLPDPQHLIDQFWLQIRNPHQISINLLQPQDVWIQPLQGKSIVVIQIPRAQKSQKPVYLGSSPFTGSYLRSGEGDMRCAVDQVQTMLEERYHQLPDNRPLKDALPEDLDETQILAYRQYYRQCNPQSDWNAAQDMCFLTHINALGFDADQVLRPSCAGMLMFGRQKAMQRWFPDLRLCDQLTGKTKDHDCLFHFWGQLKQYLQQQKDPTAAQALSEAIINALIHTDYHQHPHILLRQRGDEIQILNTGQLKRQHILNPVLHQLFHYLGEADARGSGLRRIESLQKREGWKEPLLSEDPRTRQVLFRMPMTSRERRHQYWQQAVLTLLTENVSLTPFQLSERLSCPLQLLNPILRQLLREKLICLDPQSKTLRLKD